MGFSLAEEFFSIVLRGKIGPYEKYTPLWLLNNDLLSQSEALSSNIEIISNAATLFSLEWASIRFIEDMFQISSDDMGNIEMVRDLFVNILNLTSDPPIRAIGLNYHFLCSFSTQEEWHRFGHSIAPKSFWKGGFEKLGLLSMVLTEVREDPPGYIQIQTSSASPDGGKDGGEHDVKFVINHHYDMKDKNVDQTTSIIKDYITRNLDVSRNIIKETVQGVFDVDQR